METAAQNIQMLGTKPKYTKSVVQHSGNQEVHSVSGSASPRKATLTCFCCGRAGHVVGNCRLSGVWETWTPTTCLHESTKTPGERTTAGAGTAGGGQLPLSSCEVTWYTHCTPHCCDPQGEGLSYPDVGASLSIRICGLWPGRTLHCT